MSSAVVWGSVLYVWIRVCWSVALVPSICLLIFCLVVLPVAQTGVLKSPTIIVCLAVSRASPISCCFTDFAALLFGAYPLVPNRTVLSSDAA